jgi:hypothetical protein
VNRAGATVSLLLAISMAAMSAGSHPRAASTAASIDPTGTLPRIAEQKLTQFKHHPPTFAWDADSSMMDRASLDPPFLFFAADSFFFGYERAEPRDLLRYTNWLQVCFPVRVDTHIIGAIYLQEKERRPYDPAVPIESGHWHFSGLYGELYGENAIERLHRLSRQAMSTEPRRVSILWTLTAGSYFIVEDGSFVYGMIPIEPWLREELGLGSVPLDSLRFAPPEHFAPMIRAKIAQARRAAVDAVPFDEPMKMLPGDTLEDMVPH